MCSAVFWLVVCSLGSNKMDFSEKGQLKVNQLLLVISDFVLVFAFHWNELTYGSEGKIHHWDHASDLFIHQTLDACVYIPVNREK